MLSFCRMAYRRRNSKRKKITTKKASIKNVNIKRAGFRTQNYIHNRMHEKEEKKIRNCVESQNKQSNRIERRAAQSEQQCMYILHI